MFCSAVWQVSRQERCSRKEARRLVSRGGHAQTGWFTTMRLFFHGPGAVSYTHLRAHET